MINNFTKEDFAQLKEQFSSKQVKYSFHLLNQIKRKTLIVGFSIIFIILIGTIVLCSIGNYIVRLSLPLLLLIVVPFFISFVHSYNKNLNEFIKQISNNKLTYKEFKILNSLKKLYKGFLP